MQLLAPLPLAHDQIGLFQDAQVLAQGLTRNLDAVAEFAVYAAWAAWWTAGVARQGRNVTIVQGSERTWQRERFDALVTARLMEVTV